MKDEDRLSFVEAYPQKDNYSNGPGTLSETLDTIPKLLQWDLRWGYIPYGENDIYLTGCAPTVFLWFLVIFYKIPHLHRMFWQAILPSRDFMSMEQELTGNF